MSRVGVLGVWHETNTYSARPTAIEDFRAHELLRGDDIVRRRGLDGRDQVTHRRVVPGSSGHDDRAQRGEDLGQAISIRHRDQGRRLFGHSDCPGLTADACLNLILQVDDRYVPNLAGAPSHLHRLPGLVRVHMDVEQTPAPHHHQGIAQIPQ